MLPKGTFIGIFLMMLLPCQSKLVNEEQELNSEQHKYKFLTGCKSGVKEILKLDH
jgi:hypothetical protein